VTGRRANPEADIQRLIVRDLHRVLSPPFVLHHSANEAGKSSRAAQGILMGMGVWAGFSDLVLLWPERRVLFLEVKTSRGEQNDAQKAFERDVVSFGWPYEIVRSSEEAIAAARAHGCPTRIKAPL